MTQRTIEPYRDETLPERFLRWIETIRARFKTIPNYTEFTGSPEGVIFGTKADRYYDLTADEVYVKTTTSGNTGWVLITTGGQDATFQGLGQWRYRTSTAGTPSAGQLEFDNVDINLATEFYLNVTNDNGVDMTAFLGLIQENDLVYIQVSNDSAKYVVTQVGIPSLAASVYTFPIVLAEGVGGGVTNNTPVSVVTAAPGGGGGGGGGGGAAGTISYIYDNNIGGTDPGSTFFRMSTANPASVTQFRFSDDDINSVDVQNILGNMVVGGYFILRKADDNTQFRVYAITTIVDNAGWYTFNVNYLNAQSSGDNPIPNSSEILFEFFVSAMLAPTVGVGNNRPFAVWDTSDTRYEGSGTLITCNPASPPLGGRLFLGTTSGASITAPQILRSLGAADTYMDVIYGSDPNNAFYQRYFRVAGEMHFGANISSTITDLLTFTLDAEVVLPLESALMFEGKGAAATDKTGHGQLYVSTADDGLYYKFDGDVAVRLDAGGAAPVDSVFTRTGAVVALVGDYSAHYLVKTGGAQTCVSDVTINGGGGLTIDDPTINFRLRNSTDLLMYSSGNTENFRISQSASLVQFTGSGFNPPDHTLQIQNFVGLDINVQTYFQPPLAVGGNSNPGSGASWNAPQGTAPTTPLNGDWWQTTLGAFSRINGRTQLMDPSRSELNVQDGNYTLLLSDQGKTIAKRAGGAGETYTIPANASVAYEIGAWVAFDNDGGGDLTIAITTDVLVGTDGVTGSRTLGDNQRAMAQKINTTRWRYQATDL